MPRKQKKRTISKMPRVSVLIPAFNAENTLSSTLETLTSQTFRDFEMIIVNDGSTDSTLKIANEYMRKYRNIKVIDKKNTGISDSLNIGIDNSNGEYIARADADDLYSEDRLEIQVNFLDRNPNIGVVASSYIPFDKSGYELKEIKHPTDPEIISLLLTFCCPICHPSTMIRKELLMTDRYKEVPNEDHALWTELALYTQFSNINKPLIRYRLSTNSLSKQNKTTICFHTKLQGIVYLFKNHKKVAMMRTSKLRKYSKIYPNLNWRLALAFLIVAKIIRIVSYTNPTGR